MKTVVAVIMLLCVAVACAERNIVQRGLIGRPAIGGNQQPYWFLGGPRTRSNAVQAIQVPISAADLADDDEDDDDQESFPLNDEDDEETDLYDDLDDDNTGNDDDNIQEILSNGNNILGVVPLFGGNSLGKNYWRALLAKNGGNAGSILVPDGIIELNGQGIVDDETGETALFVPREALANIPDGSVVALIEDSEGMGKANKVIVRRRRKGNGNRKNLKRGGNRRRRRGGNKRRPNQVRVIRPQAVRASGQGGNRRTRVPNVIRI